MMLTQSNTHEDTPKPEHFRRALIRRLAPCRYDHSIRTFSVGKTFDLFDHVFTLCEVNKSFAAQLSAQVSFIGSSIDTYDTHTHSSSDLDSHVSHSATGTGENNPFSWLEARLDQLSDIDSADEEQ